MAIRKGHSWSASLIERLARGSNGDVQILELRDVSGELMVRIANIYAAPVFGSGSTDRPCEEMDWTEVLDDQVGVVGGDFNSHSSRWDPREERQRGRGADWTLNVIDQIDLRVINDGTSTYHRNKSDYEAVLDLTLAERGLR